MSGESVPELPEELREWVEQRAAESDRDPGDVLTEAVTAYQMLETDGDAIETNRASETAIVLPDDSSVADRLDEFEQRLGDLESLHERLSELDAVDERLSELDAIEERLSELDAIDERLSDLEAELDEKIDDVRERVIQVKREADAKAPTDHDHDQLQQHLQRAQRAAEEANATSKQIEDRIDRVDQGFENFEEVLEYLTDATDELEEKLDALAYTVIDLRQTVGELEGSESARVAAAELKAQANREGVAAAKCGDCESKVRIGLLSMPRCPHCGTTFRELDPSQGLFGSSYLRAGDRPALESGDRDTPDSPEDLFEEFDAGERSP
jgi:chromosome segregation ATPase